jgi:hypothetical protein
MKTRVAAQFVFMLITVACESPKQNNTILLAGTYNVNGKCVGHATGLCGTEQENLPAEIEGVFATEPDCRGLKLRGLTEKERNIPTNQLPLSLNIFYEGTHTGPYMGTGKGEGQGWRFTFNGPNGYFSSKAKTESEMVRGVCNATRGSGAQIQ